MITGTTLYILGADDPEMQMIETVIRTAGHQVAYAVTTKPTPEDPRATARVHPGNAYKATEMSPPLGYTTKKVVYVECDLPAAVNDPEDDNPGTPQVFRVDHHRPGDPGFGRPPEEYWVASSLGQVCGLLGIGSGSGRMMCQAAADHCLESAYRGMCPGVDPGELFRYRVAQKAEFSGRHAADIEAEIRAAKDAIASAAWIRSQFPIKDLRGPRIPELPEAACMEGVAYLATVVDPDGRAKIVLGAATPDMVQAFLDGDVAPGLTGHYGDPARGFAGAYVLSAVH